MSSEQFQIGQPVKKVTGDYQIKGIVRSVFLTGAGNTRIVVEHTVADADGSGSFLHIYGPNNLAAVEQSAMVVPEGWKLVPIEPLLNMMSDKDHDTRIVAERQLLAMLAAAPTPEQPAKEVK